MRVHGKVGTTYAIALLAIAAAACGGEAASPADEWVGTIATEGDVTTVVNEAGSVWGGGGRLVEEMSIGVEAGADEYMFGFLNSMYANDERIVIVDEQADIVRMYDRGGQFLFNVGAQGQGPGEYVDPMILTMDADSHSYVYDIRSRRLTEFDAEGEYVASIPMGEFGCCAWNMRPLPGGLVSVPVRERDPETREERFGVQPYSMEGPAGGPIWMPEIDWEPTTFAFDGRTPSTPFSPRLVWYTTPDGGLVAGASDQYRFEVLRPDGSKLIVHHYAERAEIGADELEWHRRNYVSIYRRQREDFNWDGAEMPRVRRAFVVFNPAVTGEIWVGRAIGSRRVPDCTEDPLQVREGGEFSIQRCFDEVFTLDVFDADGRFLGEVAVPPDMNPYGLYIDGDAVISGFNEDDFGVVRVKAYRLERPDGGS